MNAIKLVEKKDWNYSIYEEGNTILLSVTIPKPAPGFNILYTLTKAEKEHYLSAGIKSFENRIEDMKINFSNYKMNSWR